MAINFAAAKQSWDINVFDDFKKTLTRIPVTTSIKNAGGAETLTDGTSVTFEAVFFRKETTWAQKNPGLLENADAMILYRTTQTLNRNDKIQFDGQTFRVQDEPLTRYLGNTAFYKYARLFLMT